MLCQQSCSRPACPPSPLGEGGDSWCLEENGLKMGHLPKKPSLSSPSPTVHRQHFPFFRTAPEGWKNTVRHNLCFRDSFEKVPVSMQVGEGSRPRSCLWKLTEEGHRRFTEEARALASSQLESIRRSMSQPGVRPCHTWGGGRRGVGNQVTPWWGDTFHGKGRG